jgi:Tol biopolymer transport system component
VSGVAVRVGPSVVDVAADASGNFALLVEGVDGSDHVDFQSTQSGGELPLTTDTGLSDRSPSFSPDGKTVVFSRVNAHVPTESEGIWVVRSDGTGLAQLSPDGAYTRWLP